MNEESFFYAGARPQRVDGSNSETRAELNYPADLQRPSLMDDAMGRWRSCWCGVIPTCGEGGAPDQHPPNGACRVPADRRQRQQGVLPQEVLLQEVFLQVVLLQVVLQGGRPLV